MSMNNLKNQENIASLSSIFIFIGFVALIVSVFLGYQERMWHSYLLSYVYFVLISLGGLFFISIHYVCTAGWSVNIRRLSEALTAYLPMAFLLTFPLLYGAFSLYDWLDPEKVASDHLLQHKSPYLNLPFFLIRVGVFFAGWIFFAKQLTGLSLKQDQDGDKNWTHKALKYSIFFLLFFCFSLSFFSVDFLMSLDPHWFSTIFGVYIFAGLFQSIFAILILLSAYVIQHKDYKEFINANHFHDMGKFLFAATIFWAYIAFSQYMLIWYANLPEETTFFIPRSQGAWAWVSISLLVFKFIVPFLALLPRWTKRNLNALVPIACLILFMQLVDLYWLIYPHFNSEFPRFGLLEIAVFLGFTGIFIKSVFAFLQKHSLVPLKDPRAQESLKHHVIY